MAEVVVSFTAQAAKFYLVDTFTTGDNLNILKTENICQAIDDGCKSASGKCAKCDTYGYECDAALSAQENCQAWCTAFSRCKLIFLLLDLMQSFYFFSFVL